MSVVMGPCFRRDAGELHPRSPDAHVKRALAAVADMRLLKADHQRAEFRLAQPLRHLEAQNAPLGFCSHHDYDGDDQHKAQTVEMGALQKASERAVRTRLRHPM